MVQARILVADDDPIVRKLVASTLRDEGYEVIVASDGLEALEQATVQRPDVIVLDLQMPNLDGRETYRELRRRGIDAPALIVSATGAHEARAELNASAAMEKPFDPVELIRRIEQMVTDPGGADAPASATDEL